jgi:hypothetical protein
MASIKTDEDDKPKSKAAAALAAVDAIGVEAWSPPPSTRRLGPTPDVIVVDCDQTRECDAFIAIGKAMGERPFDMVPFRRLRGDAVPFMAEGASDPSHLGVSDATVRDVKFVAARSRFEIAARRLAEQKLFPELVGDATEQDILDDAATIVGGVDRRF